MDPLEVTRREIHKYKLPSSLAFIFRTPELLLKRSTTTQSSSLTLLTTTLQQQRNKHFETNPGFASELPPALIHHGTVIRT
ncbi:hypothetical protein TNIN_359271 [Trichonephila inaurata madagascariensis]|uniref:Uncharacterized protein n=1 Tax=Trichonephila inaurata madagascariensis TaxID=2747483 RepID=A0A8X6XD49_9ARAC|nr:hypothetical protein TNIN_359271 [Trichonephila inaurata madagascariensis]